MELFVIIVNGWKPLTIITKSFILDIAAVLDQPLKTLSTNQIAESRSFDNILNLSLHEQVCLMRQRFKRYLTHHLVQ